MYFDISTSNMDKTLLAALLSLKGSTLAMALGLMP
jgi:hypothetical protein